MSRSSGRFALCVILFVGTRAMADTTTPSSSAGSPPARIVTDQVQFETGKARLLPASDATIDQVKAALDRRPEITRLRIEVHTDSMGADEYNQRMSEERALAV